ncbi:DUF6944 family repetitive protein [Halobacillus litoralis]|uniref:DUF6944 family repetitive protein n=1 Tax=Halobacillus litoralis TaxID=45668 RepID=UPI001CFEA388|nr:hypothetical protein [Halobacillus litoralis]
MEEDHLTLGGLWVIAAGTIASAVSASLDREAEGLNLIGNSLQASGNALTANGARTALDLSGSLIQSSGNTTIVYSILADLKREDRLNLVIKGNLLQALGGSINFSDTFHISPSILNAYKRNGELLEVIGNSLQAIAAGKEKQGIESRQLEAAGSWIQAIGAVIVALAETKKQQTNLLNVHKAGGRPRL